MSGPTVLGFDVSGEPAAWSSLGFAVDGDGRCAIGRVLLSIGTQGGLPPGLIGWTIGPALGDGAVDGIATTRVADVPEPAVAAVHPIGATSVDHVVLATPDLPRTVAALEATGMTLRRERDGGPDDNRVRQAFFRHGECVVEAVGPIEPDADGGPARLWGLTLTVADIDATARLLGDRLGAVRDAVQPGRRIATVRREAGLGVPLALMSPAP